MRPVVAVGSDSDPIYIPNFYTRYVVPLDRQIKLSDYDPDDTAGLEKCEALEEVFKSNTKRIKELHHVLTAEGRRSFLGVLEGIGTAGKDRTIKRVMRRADPNYSQVTHFKAPSEEELQQDFLARIHGPMTRKGKIGWYHRSHYGDVVPVRVKNLVPESVWRARFDQINAFEKILSECGVTIMKFFLLISKEENKERLIERRDDPKKQWKLSMNDLDEREHWDENMKAYEDAINKCNTPWSRWFVIPGNHRWFKDLTISQLVADELESMNPQYPPPSFDPAKIKIE